MTDADLSALRLSCHSLLPGHRQPSPAETFAAMAQWCEANQIKHDTYGEGELVQQFEQKIADLLGMPAALFCMTGTMTQVKEAGAATSVRLDGLTPNQSYSFVVIPYNVIGEGPVSNVRTIVTPAPSGLAPSQVR